MTQILNRNRVHLAGNLVSAVFKEKLPVDLYGYQRDTLVAIIQWLYRKGAPSRAYIAQATGLGKTVQYATIVRACRGLRVLIIVPNKILIEQSIRDLTGFATGTIAQASSMKDVKGLAGETLATHWKGKEHDILVTTDETFKFQYLKMKEELNPDVIIWDECHGSYTELAQTALAAFPDAIVIGLSATPDYLTTVAKPEYIPVTLDNGVVLYAPPDRLARTYYPELICDRGVRWGIENGHLAPLAWGQLDFKLNLDDISTVETPYGLDFDQAELQHVMRTNWPFIVQTVRRLYESGQYDLAKCLSAAICPGVAEAESIAEELRSIGIDAEAITQRTSDAERGKILARDQSGELQFVSSVFALREGWNSKRAAVAMMLRPTKSRVLYMQFMGRVLRWLEGKIALVLDPHYQNTRFAPLSTPVLLGVPGQKVYNGGILVGKKGKNDLGFLTAELLKRLEPVLTVEPIETEYWAGEDGIIEAKGKRWATINTLAESFGLSRKTIESYLGSCPVLRGKNASGRTCVFFSVENAKAAMGDRLDELPLASAEGTFEFKGETWGTERACAEILGVSKSTVNMSRHKCRTQRGKTQNGNVFEFLALADIRRELGALIKNIPRTEKNGFFEEGEELWGTRESCAKALGLPRGTVKIRLLSRPCRNRPGRDFTGCPRTLYAFSDVQKACENVKSRKKKE